MPGTTTTPRNTNTPLFAGTAVPPTGHILVAEDDAALRELLVEVLNEVGHTVTAVNNGVDATARLKKDNGFTDDFDVVLTDLVMPGLGGEAVLACALEHAPNVPVIVSTAFGSVESAVRTVRTGAYDYVTKPVGTAQLLQSIERALLYKRQSDSRLGAGASPSGDSTPVTRDEPGDDVLSTVFSGLIAESASMRRLLSLTERVAPSQHPVLLTGESGSGKEVIAHAIHTISRRSPFIVVNCGAIPEPMVEAELFGHERGALPGSDREGGGLFAAAHGGTLFLDEVAELPLSLQPALLRFLESGVVRRVGGHIDQRFDVRVIAATNRDLEGETSAGRFREDLYWRLNVLPLDVAPLRERVEDILPLAHEFLLESGVARTLDPSTESLLA
jgi:two-component system response regulator HydG